MYLNTLKYISSFQTICTLILFLKNVPDFLVSTEKTVQSLNGIILRLTLLL